MTKHNVYAKVVGGLLGMIMLFGSAQALQVRIAVIGAKQDSSNGCWAACCTMILDYYYPANSNSQTDIMNYGTLGKNTGNILYSSSSYGDWTPQCDTIYADSIYSYQDTVFDDTGGIFAIFTNLDTIQVPRKECPGPYHADRKSVV